MEKGRTKILITGATGLVGSEIVKLCAKRNIDVNYLTTRKSKIKTTANLKGYFWNPSEQIIDPECIEGVTAIINLAGANVAKRWTDSHKKVVLQSRIYALQTLQTLLEKKPNHLVTSFVTASAIGIYPSSLSDYYTEDDATTSTTFLGKVVTEWENAASKIATLGIPVSKIRIGIVLSKDGGALPQIMKPVKLFAGAPLGNGEQWQSWIHIKDVAEMFLFAIENKLEGIYNGVAPNPITNCKLTKEIARVLRKPLVLPNVPESILRLALGEMANILFDSQRVSSKKIETEGFHFQFTNISNALQDILTEDNEVSTEKELVS